MGRNNDFVGLDECMTTLIISEVDTLQSSADSVVRFFSSKKYVGVYVCFNKPQKAVKSHIIKEKIKADKIFFIDCITSFIGKANKEEGVLHICSPADLTGLQSAIHEFIKSVPHAKYVFIDALAVALIYNKEETILKFVKSLLETCHERNTRVIVLTPEIHKGELTAHVMDLFDRVIRV
jgi:hypothetical protein